MPVRIEHASQLGADARAVAPTRPAAISSHKRERTERREIFKNGPAAGRAKTFTSDPLVAGFDQLMHNCGGGGEGDWNFSGPPNPNAFIQIGNMTLELQCDRVRFAPAGYEDSQDIVSKQGISFRFMKNGSTEVGAFQAGSANADIAIVDNYPVEVRFYDRADYDFVLDQIARNAVLNLSMIDQDVTYGIFSLKGSGAAVRSLRAACSSSASGSQSQGMEAPEGIVYCGGGAVQRVIEYAIVGQPGDQWDAVVTVNGETIRAMTSYSFFGNSQPPAGFQVALLGEDRSEFLVFSDGGRNWLEFGDYTYEQCN